MSRFTYPTSGRPSRGLAVVLVCLAGLCGCGAPAHVSVNPAGLDAGRETHVRTTIEKEEIGIFLEKSTAGASGIGLIGRMLDKSADAGRSRRAEEWITPLLDETSDIDFRKDFWSELLPTLRSLPWLKLGQTELVATPVELPDGWWFDRAGHGGLDRVPEDLSEDWLDDNVLHVYVDYAITPDGRHFVMISLVRLWTEPDSKPSYSAILTYLSDAVGEGGGGEALDAWAADGGEVYRAALEEGIGETMRMLRMDLAGDAAAAERGSGAKVRIRVPTMRGLYETIDGTFLENGKDRAVFRLQNGNLRSLPMAEVEYR